MTEPTPEEETTSEDTTQNTTGDDGSAPDPTPATVTEIVHFQGTVTKDNQYRGASILSSYASRQEGDVYRGMPATNADIQHANPDDAVAQDDPGSMKVFHTSQRWPLGTITVDKRPGRDGHFFYTVWKYVRAKQINFSKWRIDEGFRFESDGGYSTDPAWMAGVKPVPRDVMIRGNSGGYWHNGKRVY